MRSQPSVGARGGGLGLVLEASVASAGAGIVVARGDPRELADDLCALAAYPRRRAQLGSAGQKLAEREIGRAAALNRWQALESCM
jgi:hypothetical protein